MIELPRRSVTRFFIPLIDVLTLLFCIFLLMPLIKGAAETAEPAPKTVDGATDDRRAADSADTNRDKTESDRVIQERLRLERQELEKLRKEKIDALQQRLFIRVLEIDADTGKLMYQEGDQRIELRSQDDVLKLVAQHGHEAGTRELYYLFLHPRRLTGFPVQEQIDRYEGWFRGVAHGNDNPRATR